MVTPFPLVSTFSIPPPRASNPSIGTTVTSMNSKWCDLINPPLTILITGRRRFGKTALGMRILEIVHEKAKLPCYVIGLPKEKWHLLPSFIQGMDLEVDLPENCAIFIDEAAFKLYARDPTKLMNKWITHIIAASGQKNQTILFASHHTRKLDINVVMDMDLWALKKPSKWYMRFERKELKEIVSEAFKIFSGLPSGISKRASVIYGHDFNGLVVENDLPSFWSEELSTAFSGVLLSENKISGVDGNKHVVELSAGHNREKESKIQYEKESQRIQNEIIKKWTVFEEQLQVGESVVDTRAWIERRKVPAKEGFTLTEEEQLKKESLYVTNGLTIYYSQDLHPKVQSVIAELLKTTPEKVYDASKPTDIPGKEKRISFDLTRKSSKAKWMAAGGRFAPSDLIQKISQIDSEKTAVAIDPLYAEDIA